jgi:hypothetical protein
MGLARRQGWTGGLDGYGVDGHDEQFPTELDAWLPAPRRPHPSEILPPRVYGPRVGGSSQAKSRPRPQIGLATPPPLIRIRPFVGRDRWTRALMLAGMLTAVLAAAVAFASTAYSADLGRPELLALAGLAVATMEVLAVLGPRVSYRRRDAFLGLVPIVGAAVTVKVLWRFTALPDKYWPPRVDELAPPIDPEARRPMDFDFWETAP